MSIPLAMQFGLQEPHSNSAPAEKVCPLDIQAQKKTPANSGGQAGSASVRKQRPHGDMENRVLDILNGGTAKTTRQLAQAIGTTHGNLCHVLRRMRDRGVIFRDHICCWHLSPKSAQPPGSSQTEPIPVSFRFQGRSGDSLLIVVAGRSVELPDESVRCLTAFLNNHFSERRD